MAILSLVIAPDPRLEQKSLPVAEVNDEIRRFMDDMLETMYYMEGAGLAAVQVGVLKRIMVIDIGHKNNEDAKNPIFLVNPEITYFSPEKCIKNEGCLSFPEQRIEIERPAQLRVKYLDYYGKLQEIEADDWLARAVLHEMDHLDGIVIADHVSRLKKDIMIRKAKKIKKMVAEQ